MFPSKSSKDSEENIKITTPRQDLRAGKISFGHFSMILRIGTRGSKLALVQSEWVKKEVQTHHPEVRIELVKIKTRGDKILDSPLSKIGGKGLFVKEIEDALLKRDVDLAVHSMKDVPAELQKKLTISVYPKREDPRDAFVSRYFKALKDLPQGASVGTSSLRRSAQLLHMRPDLHIVPLRGNVDTRLRKLESGNLQAIVLATAGLRPSGAFRQNHGPAVALIRYCPRSGKASWGWS